ncbi:MAG: SDR family NAD(P)-dependent oxidoreductase, partial [Chloroflexi bacterium]|nr:SDR family NAD(P)-dependent oxidoreductase [Chloroflexota bacterium]
TPALQASLSSLWDKQTHDEEARFQQQLAATSLTYVLAAFAKVGFTFQPGMRWRNEQIAQQVGVIPQYRRLLERMLGMLAEAGILQRIGEEWLVVQTPRAQLPILAPTNRPQASTERAEVTLLEQCGPKLSEVLRGLQEPLELLFPGGDTGIVTQLYTESPGAISMNKLVQQAVSAIIQHLPLARGMRIVEVGAGTGGTTVGLLPLLPAAQIEYCFTDIGPRFLSKAQERFADYNFIRYQPLDIEQSPLTQGFAPQQADLVIAANVLHATRNLMETLGHVRQLLQPDGWLVLVEATSRSRWVDLTFGLTDGWWRFADDRQDYPLLTAPQWQTRLYENGFQAVETFEQDGQTLILGQLAVRQAHQPLERAAWLIFADTQGVGAALAAQLQAQGEEAVLVYASDHYQQVDGQTFWIRPDTLTDYQALLTAQSSLQGIVHLWSLDAPNVQSAADVAQAAQLGCGTVLLLVQALLANQFTFTTAAGGLCLVTQDVQLVSEQDKATGMAQAGLWGLGKVIALEHPELRCRCIDLAATPVGESQAQQLWAELKGAPTPAGQEAQVALRGGARYVARLGRHTPEANLAIPDEPYQLTITERGTLDHLALQSLTRRPPATGEVEIQVQASGLNFRDLLNSLDLYPGDPGPIGAECTGVIVAVGDGVANFALGDAVLALCAGSFSQYVTVDAIQVVHKPATLSYHAAATIPIAFLTAYYGLHHLGQMKAGDRVLIHAATGGVGMAAVQLAQLAGAEVFGTASPGKWDTLRKLGVTHIYNSRREPDGRDFAQAVMADTGGQGINLILNSLTGPGFIEANLALLAADGHVVEMSKRGIWTPEQVAAVRPDGQYTAFDLGEVMRQQPQLVNDIFTMLMARFATNSLKPLPYRTFPLPAAGRAFRLMQQAKQIGKLVLLPPATQAIKIQADATYLITGGLGGLGLAMAEWLAAQGARQLLLLGRGHPKPVAQAQIAALSAKGVTVTIAQADVTNLEALKTTLQQVDERYPLRGLIHAVGVLDDGALRQQNWARFARVLAPKVTGAWHLHALTKELPLDFFVLFSSASSLFGNHGQANHAAANAFLDAFAAYRQAQGLPCLSINWGAWSEIGAAADRVRGQKQQMAEQGVGVITPQQGVAAFAYLLQQTEPQVGVAPMAWPKFLDRPFRNAFYAAFTAPEPSSMVAVPPPVRSLRQQLLAVAGEERRRLLMDHLRGAVAKVLGLRSPEQIDPQQGLLAMGLDSLMAIELRNHLARTLEQPLPATLIFDYPMLEALSTYLLSTIRSAEDEIAAGDQITVKGPVTVDDLAQSAPDLLEADPSTENDVAQKLRRLEALLEE